MGAPGPGIGGGRGSLRAALTFAAACAGAAGQVQAADVYASTGPDGSVRYASQRLDSSYTLLFTEAAPADRAVTPSPLARHRVAADRLRPLIDELARRHDVPVALVEAVVAVESGFNPRAVSPKGARGAMQLMPATGRRYGLTEARQFESAPDNIDAGVRHLKDLLAQHQGNVALALAAYNAGSGAVQRHGQRIPPYPETMLYVPAVLGRAAASQP